MHNQDDNRTALCKMASIHQLSPQQGIHFPKAPLSQQIALFSHKIMTLLVSTNIQSILLSIAALFYESITAVFYRSIDGLVRQLSGTPIMTMANEFTFFIISETFQGVAVQTTDFLARLIASKNR
jgi:uncharacterized membrane protein